MFKIHPIKFTANVPAQAANLPVVNEIPNTDEISLPEPIILNQLEHALNMIFETLMDSEVTDLMINNHQNIYVEKQGKMQPATFVLQSNDLVFQLARTLAEYTGKSDVLREHFSLDGMLPEGHRITIIMPPASLICPSISIRSFPKDIITLDDMANGLQMTEQMAAFLKMAVARRANILISGNTSSGKTTLLNALTAHIDKNDRLVTIEDTAEIRAQQDNVVRLEINDVATKSGSNYATARELLKSTLRIRPDRIIMGEIRGAEAFDLLQAINTGHKGSMGTMHANTPREALSRLEHMVGMAHLDISTSHIRHHIAASLNLFIQTHRNHNGQRRITHITELVGMEGDTFLTHDHFVYKRDSWGTPRHHWLSGNSRASCIKEALEAAAAVKKD